MRWFLIFNPFAGIRMLLLALCVLTVGFLLAINVIIVEINDANGSRHTIASDPERVYFPPASRRTTSHDR
jgi:hypothetical protein